MDLTQQNTEKYKYKNTEKKYKFIDKSFIYIVFAITVFSIFFMILKNYGAYPFGDATISNYDYLAQTAPFMEFFYSVLKGESSLFYSYNIAGGADMFQSLAFMMISPFTILTLFFGPENTVNAISFILPLKIVCIGFSCIYYIKKRFPNISPYAIFAIALIYSTCGYVGTSNTYINWMDFLIYIPFVALGFEKLVKTGSVKMHAIASAFMIYTCFSISCFSLLLLFPVYFAYVFIVVDKQNRKKVMTNICISLIYTILLALPLLLPALISSSKSSRNVGLFDYLDRPIEEGIDHLMVKLSYIFSDTFLVILSILYMLKNRHSKIGKFLIVANLIILAPVLIDESCYLLNAGSYNHYALRFGFLNAFSVLFTSCLFLSQYSQEKTFDSFTTKEFYEKEKVSTNTDKDPTFKEMFLSLPFVKAFKEAKNKKQIIIEILSCIVFAIFTIYITSLLIQLFKTSTNLVRTEIKISGNSSYKYDTDRDTGTFAQHYAHSEGGFNVIMWLFLFAVIIFIAAYLLTKKKIITLRICSLILVIFTLGQATFMFTTLVDGNYSTLNNYSQYKEVTTNLKNGEEDYNNYRVSTYTGFVNNNVGFIYDTKTVTVFSSNIDQTNFKVMQKLNFIEKTMGENNISTSSGRSFLGEVFSGSKYLIVPKSKYLYNESTNTDKNSPGNREYYAKLANGSYDSDNYMVAENIYALPMCFKFTYDKDSIPNLNTNDYFVNMQNLYNFLTNNSIGTPLFTSNHVNPIVNKNNDGSFSVYCSQNNPNNDGKGGEYFLYLNLPDDFEVTFNNEKVTDKKLWWGYSVQQNTNWWSKKITLNKDLTNKQLESYLKIMVLYPNEMKQLKNALGLSNNTINYKQKGDTISFTVNNSSGDEYVYLSNALLDGHKITVNGKKAKVIENDLGMIILKLNKGTNKVKISYHSPYFGYIGVSILISCLAIVGLTILRRKTKIVNHCETSIYYMSMALTVGLVSFFIVFPLILFIDKAFLNVSIGRIISRIKY